MQAELETDEQLDYFQSRLLELLDEGLPADEIILMLSSDPRLAEYKTYIESWQPRMLDLARRLTNKWGVKAG